MYSSFYVMFRTTPNSERNRPAFDIDRLSKIVPVGRSIFKTDDEISLNHYLKLRRGLIKHHRPLVPHNWDTSSGRLPRPHDYDIAVNVDSKHISVGSWMEAKFFKAKRTFFLVKVSAFFEEKMPLMDLLAYMMLDQIPAFKGDYNEWPQVLDAAVVARHLKGFKQSSIKLNSPVSIITSSLGPEGLGLNNFQPWSHPYVLNVLGIHCSFGSGLRRVEFEICHVDQRNATEVRYV